ncbi:hypothetical protein HF313_02515 [Massilia atriviolacea]|uniref:Uncharacterized protein n=1 Tax=Massilia atriviolacea TaxID=2495579 RepID=A0A430HP29_9BURK|nr:hypothetical protein [Massilia atriviolacea]RSZ59290.1 hypothetical protein EJB06_08905 [Massilia atriviolacea]
MTALSIRKTHYRSGTPKASNEESCGHELDFLVQRTIPDEGKYYPATPAWEFGDTVFRNIMFFRHILKRSLCS